MAADIFWQQEAAFTEPLPMSSFDLPVARIGAEFTREWKEGFLASFTPRTVA